MNKTPLYERLRSEPSPLSVPGSLPVLFFGDLFAARCATISLNPSPQEYLDRAGLELQGADRRFETLTSLNARSRAELTDSQCDQAIQTMRDYYQPGRPVYRWFRSFLHLADGIGLDWAFPGFVDSAICHSFIEWHPFSGRCPDTTLPRKVAPRPATRVAFCPLLLTDLIRPLLAAPSVRTPAA